MTHLLLHSIFFLLLLLFLISSSSSANGKNESQVALLLPVSRDYSTNQFVMRFRQKTPSTPISLVLDIGSDYTWVNCDQFSHNSSTFSYVPCNATTSFSNSCNLPGDTCGALTSNPITKRGTLGVLARDTVTIQSTDGYNPRRSLSIPNFTFSCTSNELLDGLVSSTAGIAGFARTGSSFPSQLASSLGYPNKFALCLPGVIILGEVDSYHFPYPTITPSWFVYTPLLVNPVSTAGFFLSGEPSLEYFVDVKAIKVNDKDVPTLPKELLKISANGKGGTKLSTVEPYTVMHTAIYTAVVAAFERESGLQRVAAVAPFGACYNVSEVRSTRVGIAVPTIDVVMKGKRATWRWFGTNTMVPVSLPGVMCLGLVDGGKSPRTSIVIGGYQMEDNLMMFDLVGRKFGVTGTLLFLKTTCSNFNFTYVS